MKFLKVKLKGDRLIVGTNDYVAIIPQTGEKSVKFIYRNGKITREIITVSNPRILITYLKEGPRSIRAEIVLVRGRDIFTIYSAQSRKREEILKIWNRFQRLVKRYGGH